MASWDVVEVSDANVQSETLGGKEKFWVLEPHWDPYPDLRRWLFKYVSNSTGRLLGEDWAEWMVYQIAKLIGVPTARVRPARCNNRRGIVFRSVFFDDQDESLINGNSLLVTANPENWAVVSIKTGMKPTLSIASSDAREYRKNRMTALDIHQMASLLLEVLSGRTAGT